MNKHACFAQMEASAGAAAASAMAAPLPVRWWSGDTFGLPWPAADTVRIVAVRGAADRDAARRTIREALSAALADVTNYSTADILVCGTPGEAPYALLGGDPASHRVELAISHDGELSVAAFRLDGGPVGIDVMQVTDVPDWEAVARDYLGPDCAAALGHVPAAARAEAFARAWSEREARLKCLGMPLAEWDAAESSRLAGCTCREIALPAGYVGMVATRTPAHIVAG